MSNLPQALAFVSLWEWGNKKDGGYTDDKDDPGGETKFGISKRAYPDVDIKSLTLAEASLLYEKDYWLKVGADKMEKRLAITCFDSAVNCGVGRTRSWLVELEKEKEKNPQRSESWAARWMIQRRTQYYLDLVKKKPALNKYIKGWLNRVNDLSKYVDIVTA